MDRQPDQEYDIFMIHVRPKGGDVEDIHPSGSL